MSKRIRTGGEPQVSMPCQSSKILPKHKSDGFQKEILPRKRWSLPARPTLSLAAICKKEGMVPLSPFPLLSSKQSQSDSNCFTNFGGSRILASTNGKRKATKMENECDIIVSETSDLDYSGFSPRTDATLHSFFQFSRIKRLSSQPIDNFTILPDEMILKVFKWLPKQALGRVALTCKRLKRLAADETLWRRLDLQGKILSGEHLTVVLERQPVYLRLARAQVRDPTSIPPSLQAPQLSYLDLSMSVISTETLAEVLKRCSSLVKLSLEHMVVSKSVVEAMQVFANTLDTLNITMCYEVPASSFASILKKCKSLKCLNMSCLSQDWTSEELLDVVCALPSKLEQLNAAGFRQGLNDSHVEVIVSRCPRLLELDLSDCQDIVGAVESITTLTNLQHLALSRCYSLVLTSYGLLSTMRSLRFLEVFSFFKESALETIKATLPNVKLNQYYFSAVARPTVGVRRSTIWTIRVRD